MRKILDFNSFNGGVKLLDNCIPLHFIFLEGRKKIPAKRKCRQFGLGVLHKKINENGGTTEKKLRVRLNIILAIIKHLFQLI